MLYREGLNQFLLASTVCSSSSRSDGSTQLSPNCKQHVDGFIFDLAGQLNDLAKLGELFDKRM